MKVSRVLTVSAMIILAMVSVSYSAPAISSVSGTVSKGQSITIQGTGFGSKSPAKPVLWADFENGGIAPSNLGEITSWYHGEGWVHCASCGWGGSGGITVSPSITNPISTLDLNVRISQGRNWAVNTLGQRTYIFRRAKRDFNTENIGMSGLKSLIFQPLDQYELNNIVLNVGTGQWISQQITPSSYCYYFQGDWGNYRNWMSEELVLAANTTLGGQASLNWYINGRLDCASSKGCQLSLRGGSSIKDMDQVKIAFHGAYHATGSMQDWKEYYDTLYLDNTWARVIVGDRSSWIEGATWQKEIQVPSEWTDRSITITFNQGTFVTGQTVYLYVVDANNQVNSVGYPLRIVGSNFPGSPMNLQTK